MIFFAEFFVTFSVDLALAERRMGQCTESSVKYD